MDLTRRRQDWPTRRQGLDDPFSLMFQDLQRLAGNMMSAAGHPGVDYPLNLYETDEAFVLELAVPGMSAEDIDLHMEGRHVTIQAKMPQEDEGGRRYFVRGISQEDVRQHNNECDAHEGVVPAGNGSVKYQVQAVQHERVGDGQHERSGPYRTFTTA